MQSVPASLRIWFIVHFAVDILFAIPLILVPHETLGLFAFGTVNPFTARLVGAALAGIGGASFVVRNGGLESFNTLLSLKILWSGSAMIAIIISIYEGGPISQWLFFGIFVCFSVVWIYYKVRLLSAGKA